MIQIPTLAQYGFQNFVVSPNDDQTSSKLKIKMARIRMQRNGMLSTCDWTQLSDSLLSGQVMGSWATYRQSLRDVPNQENFDPDDFEWPESP